MRRTQPARLTVDLTLEELEVVENKFLKECTICDSVKPPRAHHCSKCGRCVMRMDHHCPWLGNCIGFKNLKFFLLFNFYVFWVCLALFIVSFKEIFYCLSDVFDNDQSQTVSSYRCIRAIKDHSDISLIVCLPICLLLSFLFLIFVATLFVEQLILINEEKSKIDKMSDKQQKFKEAQISLL